MNFLILIIVFIFGTAIGSTINALVYRLRNLLPFLGARSMCPTCKHQLAVLDNIPLVSFVMLGGRCRYCHEPISIQYPLVELGTGLLFAATFFQYFGLDSLTLGIVDSFAFVSQLIFVTFLVILLIYDLKFMEIPDKIVLPAIVIAVILDALKIGLSVKAFRDLTARLQFGPQLLADPKFIQTHTMEIATPILYGALAGLVLAGIFYAIVYLSNERAMGGGDIKLAVLLGLVIPWPHLVTAMYIGFAFGAVVGIGLVLSRKKQMRQLIPLAPFLVTGVLATMFTGDSLFRWFLTLHLFS